MLLAGLKAILEGFNVKSDRPVGLNYLRDISDDVLMDTISQPIVYHQPKPQTFQLNKKTAAQPAPAFAQVPRYSYGYSTLSGGGKI